MFTIDADNVVELNKLICERDGNRHQCYDIGKVSSALHSAFYPGVPPFQHGGIAKIAGAIAFYLTQAHAFFDGNKRTAVLSATSFLAMNKIKLVYPREPDTLANLIEACASGLKTKDDLMNWFEIHKSPLI